MRNKLRKVKMLVVAFLMGIVLTQQATAQSQIGADLNGVASGDLFGESVSFNAAGDIMAVGAPNDNNVNGLNSGQVKVYQSIGGGAWTQLGGDINGSSTQNFSGFSVSLNATGDIVAIGAPQNNGGGTAINAGQVRVYQNVAGTWTQIGSDIYGEAAQDQSGWSVSLNAAGTIVAIGAIYNEGNSDSGHVRVYENIAGTWTQIGSDIDGENRFDEAGTSVSLNDAGTIVAIGAGLNDDNNGDNHGHVRIYENIAGTWTQIGSDIDGELPFDQSGASVSLNAAGTIVAIGARLNDDNGSNSGHVRIYENIADAWTQIGSDIDGEAAEDRSGVSVSLNATGDVVAIGAALNDDNGTDSGSVRIYRNIGGTWTLINEIDGGTSGESFGTSVSLNAKGDKLVAGSPSSTNGTVRAYQLGVFFKGQVSLWGAFRDVTFNGTGPAGQGLMSGELNKFSLLPLTSPYGDGVTIDASLLGHAIAENQDGGSNASIPLFWIKVELRDKNNFATIVESTSVVIDGEGFIYDPEKFIIGLLREELTTKNIHFFLPNDDYHVVLSHRNHIGVATDSPITLTSNVATTGSFSPALGQNVKGGNTQMIYDAGADVFLLSPGDVDGNGQVQVSDYGTALLDIGKSGYHNADINLDGQVQIAELIEYLLPYIGVGIQY